MFVVSVDVVACCIYRDAVIHMSQFIFGSFYFVCMENSTLIFAYLYRVIHLVVSMVQSLGEDCGIHNLPIIQAVRKILKKHEETKSVTDIVRHLRRYSKC